VKLVLAKVLMLVVKLVVKLVKALVVKMVRLVEKTKVECLDLTSEIHLVGLSAAGKEIPMEMTTVPKMEV